LRHSMRILHKRLNSGLKQSDLRGQKRSEPE